MKAMKKALALGLALAMVVTAVPVTNAQAATTGLPKNKTYAAGKSYTLKLTTPSSWKSVKTTWSEKDSEISLSSKKAKSVKVKAIKKGSAKVTAKVTFKKASKSYTKKYTCKVNVKEPSLTAAEAAIVPVGSKVDVKATQSWPTTATVTYSSDKTDIATVDEATGEVTGVKAGEATITTTLVCGTKTLTEQTKVTVKKVVLQEVKQTEVTKITAIVAGDTSDLKISDFKVTNTATNATVLVKSVSVDKTDKSKVTIETYAEMKDAKEYSVVLDGVTKTFTATDGTVAKVGLTRTEVPAAQKTEVKATISDANSVILGYFSLSNADSSKGKVTTALTITKGYVEGTEVYLPAVGDTMTAKVTYHTGTFGTDGKETDIIEDTFTLTAVDPSIVNYGFAVTIGDSAPVWTATSFKANTSIKVGVGKNAYFRITKDDGNDIATADYAAYTVETADSTKLVLNKQNLTGGNTTPVVIKGVSAGDTYILVKKDDKVVATLPVTVQGEPVATSIDLNKTSVTVMKNATVSESIEFKIKDQYSEDMTIASAVVENLSKPDGATAPTFTAVNAGDNKKTTVSVKGTDFTTAAKTGAYTYKITLKNGNKELVRTFTINYVAEGDVQAYQLSVNSEVNTTVTNGTANASAFDFTIKVVEMANGAAIQDYKAGSSLSHGVTNRGNVEYIIKDKDGKTVAQMGGTTTVTCGAISVPSALTNDQLTVKPVTQSSAGYKKVLGTGTYYVTAKFKVDGRDVAVSGSFTVKDEQDTKVYVDYKNANKNNDIGSTTVAAAFKDKTLIVVTYDGVEQTISDVAYVDGTIAGNTAYVRSVDLYVTVTGDNSNKVLVNVPVNQTFTNVSGL